VRFELTAYALMPDVQIIAPWRDPAFNSVIKGRKEAIEYAKRHDIPIPVSKKEPWSNDENLLHISYEAGELEDPARKPRESMYHLTMPVKRVKAAAETVRIDFVAGDNYTIASSTPAAVSGYPAVTLPAGDVHGLPVGVTLFGRPWSEPQLIGYAYALEQATRAILRPGLVPTLER